jgi:hypothetical protein
LLFCEWKVRTGNSSVVGRNGIEDVAAARYRSDDGLAFIAYCTPDFDQALHERVVGDEGLGPDRAD